MKEFSLQCVLQAPLVALSVVAISLLVGCSSGSDSVAPPAARLVGSTGGQLVVSAGVLAGTSLEIPAGALAEEVAVTIHLGQSRPSPGHGAIGPAAKIGPDAKVFIKGATLILPFDTAGIPPSTPLEKFSIKTWDGQELTDIAALGVDRVKGRVTVEIHKTCTAWVSFFGQSAPTPIREYWPMSGGDSYDFDNATTLRIVDADPILTGQLERTTQLAWTDGLRQWGFAWMWNGGDGLFWLGQYGMSGDDRRTALEPQLLSPKLVTVGTVNEQAFASVYFRRSGQTVGTFYGDELIRFEVQAQIPEMSVPLGTFRDVLQVRLHSIVGQGVRVETTLFWLARGVGPIQVQTNSAPPTALVNARVGGVQIRPN